MNDNQNDNPENWKLLTVTRGGTVSLIKGLSETKAKELAKTLNVNIQRSKIAMANGGSGGLFHCSDSDIIRTEAFD